MLYIYIIIYVYDTSPLVNYIKVFYGNSPLLIGQITRYFNGFNGHIQ